MCGVLKCVGNLRSEQERLMRCLHVFISNIPPTAFILRRSRCSAALNYCQPTHQVTANRNQTPHLAQTINRMGLTVTGST